MTSQAKDIIVKMLQSEPKFRPKIGQLAKHEFFFSGYLPPSLPVSCLTMAPRFDQALVNVRRPLNEMNIMNGKTNKTFHLFIFI